MNDALVKAFLSRFESPQQLRDWVYTYLDLDLPLGHIDPDSNSSPVEWMWEAYCNYLNNQAKEIPGYIVLSSRESYKTLTESICAIIMMCHFGCTIAHMAAIESQAKKAVEYISKYIRKVTPYLQANGYTVNTQNRREIQMVDQLGNTASVTVIIATVTGTNSPHTNLMFVDELEVMRFPQALEEAKLIPGVFNGQYPLSVYTSTRKYAFGIMQKEIENAPKSGLKILKWNYIDITEYCPPERHLPKLDKVERFIHSRLPLRNIDKNALQQLPENERADYSPITAYAGCAVCKLLPVCKMRLAHRPNTDIGGLYKPIDFTIQQFSKVSPDMAEAQLMCWRPSLSGLIYSRFDETEQTGNTYTVEQAWHALTGGVAPTRLTLDALVEQMHTLGIQFKASVDWGYRHYYSIGVHALVPSGEWWLVDTYAVAGLEFEQMIKLAEEIRDRYKIVKWYPDTSQPMFIKAFRKRKMPCVSFKKDVLGGIECVRGQIIDANGVRRLKVIKHERNTMALKMFHSHHFKLDAQGNPTQEPDDDEWADIGDQTRYFAQNHFAAKGKVISPPHPNQALTTSPSQTQQARIYSDWMTQKIAELSGGANARGKSGSGGILWDFGGGADGDEP